MALKIGLSGSWYVDIVNVMLVTPLINEKERAQNSRIGIDARMVSHEKATLLNSKIGSNSKLIFPPQNLVDLVWKNKPQKPKEKVYKQPIEFAGE